MHSISSKLFESKKPIELIEFYFLTLFLFSLPILEAPKNIFLLGFILTAIFNQFQSNVKKLWTDWDWVFLFLILSALLGAIFPGIPSGGEWHGFKTITFTTLFAWTLLRVSYDKNQIFFLFFISIVTIIFALIFALYELKISQVRNYLELHSVGHVNHSAIYLTMIFGAACGLLLSFPFKISKNFNYPLLVIVTISTLVAVFATKSRVAIFVSLLIAIVLIKTIPNLKKIKIRALCLLLGLVGLTLTFNDTVITKSIDYFLTDNSSADLKGYQILLGDRTRVWRSYFAVAKEHPLLGIGNNNSHNITKNLIENYVTSDDKQFSANLYSLPGHTHNLYLTAWVERGIIGLLAVLTLMLFWLKNLFNDYKYIKNSSFGYLWAGSFSAWMSIFLTGIFNTSFQHENALLSLFFLSLYLMGKRTKVYSQQLQHH